MGSNEVHTPPGPHDRVCDVEGKPGQGTRSVPPCWTIDPSRAVQVGLGAMQPSVEIGLQPWSVQVRVVAPVWPVGQGPCSTSPGRRELPSRPMQVVVGRRQSSKMPLHSPADPAQPQIRNLRPSVPAGQLKVSEAPSSKLVPRLPVQVGRTCAASRKVAPIRIPAGLQLNSPPRHQLRPAPLRAVTVRMFSPVRRADAGTWTVLNCQ